MLLAGLAAGTTEAVMVVSPMDLIKIRLQVCVYYICLCVCVFVCPIYINIPF